jgi:hypothetical protein
MKPYACPYCDRDLTGVHREITKSAPAADKFAVLCVWCGEPVFIDGIHFRKPTLRHQLAELLVRGWRSSRLSWRHTRKSWKKITKG